MYVREEPADLGLLKHMTAPLMCTNVRGIQYKHCPRDKRTYGWGRRHGGSWVWTPNVETIHTRKRLRSHPKEVIPLFWAERF